MTAIPASAILSWSWVDLASGAMKDECDVMTSWILCPKPFMNKLYRWLAQTNRMPNAKWWWAISVRYWDI